jgi:hypothetical protein
MENITNIKEKKLKQLWTREELIKLREKQKKEMEKATGTVNAIQGSILIINEMLNSEEHNDSDKSEKANQASP